MSNLTRRKFHRWHQSDEDDLEESSASGAGAWTIHRAKRWCTTIARNSAPRPRHWTSDGVTMAQTSSNRSRGSLYRNQRCRLGHLQTLLRWRNDMVKRPFSKIQIILFEKDNSLFAKRRIWKLYFQMWQKVLYSIFA